MKRHFETTSLRQDINSIRYSLFSPQIGKIQYSTEKGIVENSRGYGGPKFVPIDRFTLGQVHYLTKTLSDTISVPDELIGRVIRAYHDEIMWETGSQIEIVGELAVGTTDLLVGLDLLAQHDASVIDYRRRTRRFYDAVVELHGQVQAQLDRRIQELMKSLKA